MGQAESRLAFKSKVFRLAGAPDEDDLNEFISSEDPFWNMFWEEPTAAEDVFSLLSYMDIKSIREANQTNFLKLIRVIALKLIRIAHDKDFPNTTTAQTKHLLNCIRILNRVLPFLFEATALEKEINSLFWSIAYNGVPPDTNTLSGHATVGSFSSDLRGLSSLETSSTKVNINVDLRKEPSSTQADVGQGALEKPLGQELLSTLVDLLFTRAFTLEPTHLKGQDYIAWEVGIGQNGRYAQPNPELDSNRLEVLRLLVTLVSQGLYQTPKTTVSNGSRFLTTLVCTIEPRPKLLALICSTLNLICRSCKPDSENNGLTYSAPSNNHQYSTQKFYALRKTLVGYSLQLLTLMVVYPLPQQDIGFLHRLNMIPKDERAHNMVRSTLGKLHKENELNFIYSSLITMLVRPIQQAVDNEANPFNVLKTNFAASPTATTSGTQGAFNTGMPQLSTWTTEIVVLLWELIQCNKNFKNFVYGKKIQELMVTSLYYIKFYRNDPIWRPNVVRVLCYFTLYLSSDPLVTSKLLSPFSSNYYTNMLPNFYKLNTSSIPSNLSYRDFLVIQICTMLVEEDFDILITPNMFEFLYNLVPVKHNDPSIKVKAALSYHACVSLVNLVKRYSKEDVLKDSLKLDLLALVVRTITHSVCRYHKESRTLLYVLAKYESVLLNLLSSIQTIKLDDNADDSIAPDQPAPSSTFSTPVARTPEPMSPSEPADSDNEFDNDDSPDLISEESLRATPPVGMSQKAKSKLPDDAPLKKTWAGYRALLILLKVVKLVKSEIPAFGDGSRSAVVETLIKIENIGDFQEKVSRFTTSEFLPKTKFEQLCFNWSPLSLGWYESIVWGGIVYQNITMSTESSSSAWYKRTSTISLKDVASSWGFSWKSGSKEAQVEIFQFDGTILNLNIWNGTAIKLFKIKKPVSEKPLVDVSNLMKRLRMNSAASINTVDSRPSARQNSDSGMNSPNKLTPINSRQSFGTPRNSISAGTRDSIYSLSRQNSYNLG